MKKNILVIAFLFPASFLLAQDCIVVKNALKGKYEGGCSNGMANGKGIATGIDSFKGNFKNGYPDGLGKYIWKNGDWYDGHWKEGEFDGQGTYHNINGNNQDSGNLTGYWQKGIYKGKYEKPYIIHSITNGIIDVVVNKVKQQGEAIITITVKCATGGALSLSTVSKEMIIIPKSKLTNVLVQAGRIERQNTDENSSTISNRYEFRKIEYPLYATLYFEAEQLQIELLENTSYNITVNIGKGINSQQYAKAK
jgi:hypothetical protein